MSRFNIILFLMIGIATSVIAQTVVKGVVVDAEKNTPLESVHVFFTESSLGSFTDANGTFELTIDQFSRVELVVSHIGYNTVIQEIDLNEEVVDLGLIGLKSMGIQIEEVLVIAKSSSKRRKRMNQFINAFIGTSSFAKNTTLENPKAIRFKEIEDVLWVSSIEPLKIKNEALGYDITFYLEKFAMEDHFNLEYKGNTFFEELIPESKEQALKWQQNREKAYDQSIAAFFKYISDKGTRDFYRMTPARMFYDDRIISYKEKDKDSYLSYTPDDNNIILHIDNMLKVEMPEVIVETSFDIPEYKSELNDRKQQMKFLSYSSFRNKDTVGPATSYIKSNNGILIIDKYGKLVNANELEERGFWSRLRTADLLPIDYHNEIE